MSVWQRITIPEILEDEWFKVDYKPPDFYDEDETSLDDVEAVFQDSEVRSTPCLESKLMYVAGLGTNMLVDSQ